MKDPGRGLRLDQPATYRIQVQGQLDASWSNWFDEMGIVTEGQQDGPPVTTLTGVVADQAALHGLLERIRDLGLPLLEVRCVGTRE